MYRLFRPLLFSLAPETAHAATLRLLNVAHRLHLLPSAIQPNDSIELFGLKFPNRLGVAAGLDKNGTCVDALGALGFGFVEIGTVTPRPQPGNVKPRLFRLLRDEAIVNRMGFPNDGVRTVCERLRVRRHAGICGVNIGKNADTPLSEASADYLNCLAAIYPVADYAAINISSPNTTGLRRLQQGELLRSLLTALTTSRTALARVHGRHMPLLIKLTVDLEEAELAEAARIAVACGIDGIIATNTTVRRDGLRDVYRAEEGGLSGAPLLPHALRAIASLRSAVGANFPIIGVGGIASARDAAVMRTAGADLVQIYTGLIYRGPALIREILAAANG